MYPHVRQLETFDQVAADHVAHALRRRARLGVRRRWRRRWRVVVVWALRSLWRAPAAAPRRPRPLP